MEDARDESIFASVKQKSTQEWSRRFEHGFSQIVDWFWSLDDVKNSERFARDFGSGHCRFHGLLLIGRSAALSEADRSRLRWRTERVVVNSHCVHCRSYDDVYEDLLWRIQHYEAASRLPE